jgi:ABC-type sugar transport system ATPase subunit
MPAVTKTESLLVADGITKRFGGVPALTDVHLAVNPGEVHALIGANGAGKSTLIKALAGVHRPDAGTVWWQGEPAEFRNLNDAMTAGMAVMFQQLNVVDDLTVGEYLTLGREATRHGWLSGRRDYAAASSAFEQVGIEIPLSKSAGALSTAEQELLEITRAVSADARLVVMDEPTASLGQVEIERLFEVIRGLRKRGVAVLYVSHRLEEILALTDNVTVLRDGRNAGDIATADADRGTLLEMMVGTRTRKQIARSLREPGGELLRVEHLSAPTGLRDIDLTLRAGEVLGLYGLMGSGRTELMEALYGMSPHTGLIAVEGKEVDVRSPSEATSLGFGLVPEDRIHQGLIAEASVAGNLTISAPQKTTKNGIFNSRRERADARELVREVGIKTASVTAPVTSLSGGNQQKVVIGRWLFAETKILLLDDPTVGVDVAAKDEIYRLVLTLADSGSGVIVCSSELDELLTLADRIMVLHRGAIVASVPVDGAEAETLVRTAIIGADHTTTEGVMA